MSAVTIPALARPIQMAGYSGRFSIRSETESPGLKPASSNTWATLLLRSLICQRKRQLFSPRARVSKSLEKLGRNFTDLFESPHSILEDDARLFGMLLDQLLEHERDVQVVALKVLHLKKSPEVATQGSKKHRITGFRSEFVTYSTLKRFWWFMQSNYLWEISYVAAVSWIHNSQLCIRNHVFIDVEDPPQRKTYVVSLLIVLTSVPKGSDRVSVATACGFANWSETAAPRTGLCGAHRIQRCTWNGRNSILRRMYAKKRNKRNDWITTQRSFDRPHFSWHLRHVPCDGSREDVQRLEQHGLNRSIVGHLLLQWRFRSGKTMGKNPYQCLIGSSCRLKIVFHCASGSKRTTCRVTRRNLFDCDQSVVCLDTPSMYCVWIRCSWRQVPVLRWDSKAIASRTSCDRPWGLMPWRGLTVNANQILSSVWRLRRGQKVISLAKYSQKSITAFPYLLLLIRFSHFASYST